MKTPIPTIITPSRQSKDRTISQDARRPHSVSGNVVKSNIIDNDSAKMKTNRGVIQGYTGMVAVDAKHPVIVQAHAYGQGQEHDFLKPTIEGIRTHLNTDDTDVRT